MYVTTENILLEVEKCLHMALVYVLGGASVFSTDIHVRFGSINQNTGKDSSRHEKSV